MIFTFLFFKYSINIGFDIDYYYSCNFSSWSHDRPTSFARGTGRAPATYTSLFLPLFEDFLPFLLLLTVGSGDGASVGAGELVGYRVSVGYLVSVGDRVAIEGMAETVGPGYTVGSSVSATVVMAVSWLFFPFLPLLTPLAPFFPLRMR